VCDFPARSILDPGHFNTFDKVPLAQEKDNQHGNHGGDGYGHHLPDLRLPHGAVEELQTNRQRKLLRAVDVDQRLEKVVPIIYQRHYQHTQRYGFHRRHHNVDERLQR